MQNKIADWQYLPLAEIAATSPHSFVDGPFGSDLKSDEYTTEGIRLIQLQNIGDGEWIDENKKFISDKKFKQLKRHAAYPGDIAIAKMADPIARACILPEVSDRFVVVADCIKLTPDVKKFNSKYVVYAINYHNARKQAELKSTGTTRQRINLSLLKTVEIPAPSLPEQNRIAEILDTIDKAIQKTEAAIEKLKAIKQGLLNDLLTRGIDENGNLRDFAKRPGQFKNSQMGRIPKDWEVKRITEIIINHDGKRVPIKQTDRDLMKGIFPYYGASGIIDHVDSYIFDGNYVLLGEDGENIVSRVLPLAFKVTGKFWVNNHAHVLEPLKDCDIDFLAELFESKNYSPITIGSAQPKITQEALKSLFFAMPLYAEQKKIAGILTSYQVSISKEIEHLQKFRAIKIGIMSDLLTGRVRVSERSADKI